MINLQSISVSVVTVATVIALSHTSVIGQETSLDDTLRSSVVAVTIEAQNDEEGTPRGGVDYVSQGTGFFVNKFGLIVTSAHLLLKLGKVVQETIKYKIRRADDHPDVGSDAIFESIDTTHDLLVLKARGATNDSNFLRVRSETSARGMIQPSQTRVYTFGFPKNLPYGKSDDGNVGAFAGPVGQDGYLWVTNITFDEGQSGSPVCLEDGTVIGIVKGTDKDNERNNLFVPSYYLLNLLPMLQNSDGSRRIAKELSLGDLRVVSYVRTTEEQWVERVLPEERNVFCSKEEQPVSWKVVADEGWKIDKDSVQPKVIDRGHYSTFDGITDFGPSGFTLTGTLRNSGSCWWLIKDRPGHLSMRVKFKESRDSHTQRAVTVLERKIGAGELEIKLAESTVSFNVEFRTASGKEYHLAGAGQTGPLKVRDRGESIIIGLSNR